MRLPDFLIVGAQKCGTTSTRINLERHPHIAFNCGGPRSRELHFFDRESNWARGWQWYARHFTEPAPMIGEKTPNYLQTHCIERMHKTVPNARLIVLLRNPVARAYSQWNHFNQVPSASASDWRISSFATALERFPSLLRTGEYVTALSDLLNVWDHDRVGVWITERVQQDLRGAYAEMFAFLGLESHPELRFAEHHRRRYLLPLKPDDKHRLEIYYAPFNAALRELLNDPLPEWS
ncbi:MAG: sulfotransferase [Pseudomonadota bacterium]